MIGRIDGKDGALFPGEPVTGGGADRDETADSVVRNPEKKGALHKSFEDFTRATDRLQAAFDKLGEKFEQINRELEEKNRELKRAVAEKETVRNYLERILQSLTTGVVVTDTGGMITIMNRCAEKFTAIGSADAQGESLYPLFDRASFYDGQPFVSTDPGDDGAVRKCRLKERTLEIYSSGVREKGGGIIGYVHILRDVTTIEKLEERTNRSEKLAAMGEMAANIAHEIRNPLGSIELYASLLLKDAREKKETDRLRQIVGSVRNMDNKISNLLMFARKQSPLMKDVKLHRLLDEVISFSRHIVPRDHIVMDLARGSGDPVIYADEEMIKQLFLNLVLNAIQAMPDGGRCDIRTRLRKDGVKGRSTGNTAVEVRCADTGVGICTQSLNRIFDPFYSTKEECSGLGLAIAHNIVDLHGGTIDAECGDGGGTVFTVTLPVVAPGRYARGDVRTYGKG